MVLEGIKPNIQGSVGSSNGVWIVPFQILGNTIPNVNALEVGIVSVVEGSAISVELVRELWEISQL